MNELQKLESFRSDLALSETMEEIKVHESAAAAMADFAKRQKLSLDKQNEIGRFRIEVEEKKGAYLDERFPNGGDRKSELPTGTLIDEGVTKKESTKARTISKADEDVKRAIMEQIESKGDVITPNKVSTELKKLVRQEKIQSQIQEIEKGINRPDGLFDVIVIDPPWSYGRAFDPESSRVANPYPEMKQSELLRLEIPAKYNCIMWLWTTHAFIWDAKELLKEWGFDYKAILVWDKESIGMGHWLRMQTEFCLLAIKGSPVWSNTTFRDVIREKRREHSRKPESFYTMVDSICYGRKLDYFSREQREGWDSFGNDIERF